MRVALFLVFIFSSSLALNISADQFDEQASSEIIQEAEKKYKKVLKSIRFDNKSGTARNNIWWNNY